MNWRFNLGFLGKALREAINDGDDSLESCKKTLAALDDCYSAIKKRVKENEWEEISIEAETVKEHINILNIEDDALRQDRLEDKCFYGWNQQLDCVNEDLRIFYDICDEYRIWVAM